MLNNINVYCRCNTGETRTYKTWSTRELGLGHNLQSHIYPMHQWSVTTYDHTPDPTNQCRVTTYDHTIGPVQQRSVTTYDHTSDPVHQCSGRHL